MAGSAKSASDRRRYQGGESAGKSMAMAWRSRGAEPASSTSATSSENHIRRSVQQDSARAVGVRPGARHAVVEQRFGAPGPVAAFHRLVQRRPTTACRPRCRRNRAAPSSGRRAPAGTAQRGVATEHRLVQGRCIPVPTRRARWASRGVPSGARHGRSLRRRVREACAAAARTGFRSSRRVRHGACCASASSPRAHAAMNWSTADNDDSLGRPRRSWATSGRPKRRASEWAPCHPASGGGNGPGLQQRPGRALASGGGGWPTAAACPNPSPADRAAARSDRRLAPAATAVR